MLILASDGNTYAYSITPVPTNRNWAEVKVGCASGRWLYSTLSKLGTSLSECTNFTFIRTKTQSIFVENSSVRTITLTNAVLDTLLKPTPTLTVASELTTVDYSHAKYYILWTGDISGLTHADFKYMQSNTKPGALMRLSDIPADNNMCLSQIRGKKITMTINPQAL